MLHNFDRLSRADRRQGAAHDRRRGVQVVAVDHHRPTDLAHANQRAQRHHVPLPIADEQLVEIGHAVAEYAVGLNVHLPVTAELVEIVDVVRAEIDLKRLVDVVDRDAQRFGLRAVDIHVQLRRVRAKDRRPDDHVRASCRLGDERRRWPLQAGESQRAPVLDHQLEAARQPDTGHRRGAEHADRRIPDLSVAALRASSSHDRVGRNSSTPAAFVERLSRITNIEAKFEPLTVIRMDWPATAIVWCHARASQGRSSIFGHDLLVRCTEAESGNCTLTISRP